MRRFVVVVLTIPWLLAGCSARSDAPVGPALSSSGVIGYREWSSATSSSPTSRTLTVQADVESINDQLSCAPIATATVKETSTIITIHSRVINHTLPAGAACAGVGYSSIPAAVHLTHPIGTRKLIDAADGKTHDPLVLSEVPAPHPVPELFGPQHTTWIESQGEILSWWRRSHDTAQINLDIRTSTAGFERAPKDAAKVTVSGGSGVAWTQQTAPDTVDHHVIWTAPTGRAFDLDVIDQSRKPFTSAQVLALARSIH